MQISRTAAVLVASLFIMSCGGGSGGVGNGANTSPPPVQTLTGTFVDAPVAGLSYSTSSQSGATDSAGQFRYLAGETVRFEFGGVELGEAAAKQFLTPLDLYPQDPQISVVLMSFLQTLDADSDLSNGIELTGLSEDQLRSYVSEQPAIDSFPGIIARADYVSLAGRLTNRSDWIDLSTALAAFEAEIEPLIQQGLYERPPLPDPVGACPAQPQLDLYDIVGGPFYDCGVETSSRIPDPTTTRHGFGGSYPGDTSGMNFQTVCVVSGWDDGVAFAFPDLPNVDINASDQIYYNSADDFGVITFTGVRVRWNDVLDGNSGGYVCGPEARDIEYNGVCVCP